MNTQPNKFQAAYHAKAPCALKDPIMAGQVKEMMKLKPQVVAVAMDIPMSRT